MDARVDAYIAARPDDQRQELSRLRRVFAAAAPDATESMSYGMPALKVGKLTLVNYAGFSDHISIFPGSRMLKEELGDEIGPDHFTGRGTLQYTTGAPLPDVVLRKIIDVRRREIGV